MSISNKSLSKNAEIIKPVETIDFQTARRRHTLYKKRLRVQHIMGAAMILVSLIGLTLEGGFIITLALGIALTITKDIVFIP